MKSIRYTRDMIDEYLSKGYWTTEILADFWDRNAREHPDKEALVDCKTRLTWSQAKEQIDRLALGLLELGIGRDEVLVCQLPNWVEAVTLRVACEKAGILFVPTMPSARHDEIKRIFDTTEAVGIAIPREFDGFDHFRFIEDLLPDLPTLRHIFVAGNNVPQGALSLEEMARQAIETKYPSDYLQKTAFSSSEVSSIGITSGVTGLPKFIEWSTAPLILGARTTAERYKMTGDDIVIALSPISWGSVVLVGFVAAPTVAAKTVLLEKFDPEESLKFIKEEKGTIAAGSPAQLTMMVRDPNFHKYETDSLRAFCWTGAPLPYHMAIEAEETMRCTIVGMYGGQDMGVPYLVSVDDPPEVRHLTVGKPVPGTETKLVDESGKEVPGGEVGEILIRGPVCLPGRYKDPEGTLNVWGAMGKEGWYPTNDLGKFDKAGNLTVVGRKEDVIFRGGQNIYPLEIENILLTHPKVLNVAIVGLADPKEGEKVCACIIPKSGQQFTFDDMISFLEKRELSPYKLPHRLKIFGSFPMSAGGQKVQKKDLVKDITIKLDEEGKI